VGGILGVVWGFPLRVVKACSQALKCAGWRVNWVEVCPAIVLGCNHSPDAYALHPPHHLPSLPVLYHQDFTKEERMQLAVKSRTDIPKFGSAARQKVINDMHTRFMELQQSLAAAAASSSGSNGSSPAKATPAAAAVRDVQSPSRASVDQGVAGAAAAAAAAAAGAAVASPDSSKQQEQQPVFSLQQQQQQRVSQVSLGGSSDQLPPLLRSTNSGSNGGSNSPPAATAGAAPVGQQQQQQQQVVAAMQQQQVMAAAALGPGAVSDMPGDRGLTFLIVVLSVAIVAMLLKKVVVAFGDIRPAMPEV